MRAYAKAITAILTAALVALQTALSDNVVTGPEWVTIAITALGAIGVYLVPNAPDTDQAGGKHESE